VQTTVDIEELKKVIQQSVKESLEIEMMKLRSELLGYISDEEQKEIEETYHKPERDVVNG